MKIIMSMVIVGFAVLTAFSADDSLARFKAEKRSQAMHQELQDTMSKSYLNAQMILSGTGGVALPTQKREFDNRIYSEIELAAQRKAFQEAAEKFNCVICRNGDFWETNKVGKAVLFEAGQQWVKIDAEGRIVKVSPKAGFREFGWINARESVLFDELQTQEPFSTRLAEIKKKAEEQKAKEDAEEAEIARINAIDIGELFGIKFGSLDYQYSRNSLNDKLGLARPSGCMRDVRLPKPESGFIYGMIQYTRGGRVQQVIAEKDVLSKDGKTPASRDEVDAELKTLVDAYSKRYGIVLKNGTFKDLYSFHQNRKNFHFNVQKTFEGRIRVSAEAMYLAFTPEEEQLRNVKQAETNRLGRTKEEERKHVESLELTEFWGFKFGESTEGGAGKTIEKALEPANGVFDKVTLRYNVSNQLVEVSACVKRKEYASRNNMSASDAGEILHREIVRVCREIEDKNDIACLAYEIGNELTAKNHFKAWGGFIFKYNKMDIRLEENLNEIKFKICHKRLDAVKMPPPHGERRRGLLNRGRLQR